MDTEMLVILTLSLCSIAAMILSTYTYHLGKRAGIEETEIEAEALVAELWEAKRASELSDFKSNITFRRDDGRVRNSTDIA